MIKFLKNNWFLALSLISISLLGFWLRTIGLDKPGGLWNDEIVTYELVTKPINEVFWHSFPRPLYHVILHYWISFLGNADITLRFLSVIFGVINIPVIYFAGKEIDRFYKPETLKISFIGLTAALLTAINSFFIYYSQEVRQYSLLVLLSTLSVWATFRVINRPGRLNFILFFITNLIFLSTHFISVIIVISEVLLIGAFIFINKKEIFKNFLKILKLFSPLILLFLILLINKFIKLTIYSENEVINTFNVYYFDLQVFFVLLQNYFSPVLTGIYNNPSEYLFRLTENISPAKVVYVYIPVLLSSALIMIAAVKGRKKLDPAKILVLIPVIFLIIVFITSYLKTYIIISRYTLICLPFLILAVSIGINSLKNKALQVIFIFLLVGINLLYIFISPVSAPKMSRPDKQKTLARLLMDFELREKDIIIFPRIKGMINKYKNSDFKKYSYESSFLNKNNIHSLLGDEQLKNISYKKSGEVFKSFLLEKPYSGNLENYVLEGFFSQLETGNYFIIAHNKDVAYYNHNTIAQIVNNPGLYENTSTKFLLYSKITLDLMEISKKHLELQEYRRDLPWTVFIFKKVD